MTCQNNQDTHHKSSSVQSIDMSDDLRKTGTHYHHDKIAEYDILLIFANFATGTILFILMTICY